MNKGGSALKNPHKQSDSRDKQAVTVEELQLAVHPEAQKVKRTTSSVAKNV